MAGATVHLNVNWRAADDPDQYKKFKYMTIIRLFG